MSRAMFKRCVGTFCYNLQKHLNRNFEMEQNDFPILTNVKKRVKYYIVKCISDLIGYITKVILMRSKRKNIKIAAQLWSDCTAILLAYKFFILFSSFSRGISRSFEHEIHFIFTSEPRRSISNLSHPQGWFFLSVNMSPTFRTGISIL